MAETIGDGSDAARDLIRWVYRWVTTARDRVTAEGHTLPVGEPLVYIELTEPHSILLMIDTGSGMAEYVRADVHDAEAVVLIEVVMRYGLEPLSDDVLDDVEQRIDDGSAFYALAISLGEPKDTIHGLLVSRADRNKYETLFEVRAELLN